MPAATVRCHLDSLAGRICAHARGSGPAWTLWWEAVLGLLLYTVLLAWRGLLPGIRPRGSGGLDGWRIRLRPR